MAFKAPNTNKPREIIPQGTYPARLYSFVDLGLQDGTFKGQPKTSHKVFLTFELPSLTKEFDGKQKPLVISNEYTFSMASGAFLRPVVEGLIGTTLTDEEAINFDFEESIDSLLGKPCLLSVVHTVSKKNGETYANIGSVIPPISGMEVPSQFNENTFYLLSHGDNEVFKNLPKFLVDKIMKSKSEQTVDSETADKLRKLRNGENYDVPVDPSHNIPF
jgi:hypothetical protein